MELFVAYIFMVNKCDGLWWSIFFSKAAKLLMPYEMQ